VPVCGVTITTGLCVQWAAPMAVTQLLMSGPFWPNGTQANSSPQPQKGQRENKKTVQSIPYL
jgi:hypothetical protein